MSGPLTKRNKAKPERDSSSGDETDIEDLPPKRRVRSFPTLAHIQNSPTHTVLLRSTEMREPTSTHSSMVRATMGDVKRMFKFQIYSIHNIRFDRPKPLCVHAYITNFFSVLRQLIRCGSHGAHDAWSGAQASLCEILRAQGIISNDEVCGECSVCNEFETADRSSAIVQGPKRQGQRIGRISEEDTGREKDW